MTFNHFIGCLKVIMVVALITVLTAKLVNPAATKSIPSVLSAGLGSLLPRICTVVPVGMMMCRENLSRAEISDQQPELRPVIGFLFWSVSKSPRVFMMVSHTWLNTFGIVFLL